MKRGLPGLPRPSRQHRIQRQAGPALHDFPSLAEMRAEWAARIHSVRRQLRRAPGVFQRRALIALLGRLRRARSRLHGSMANPVCMHRLRRRIAGHLWALVARTASMRPRTCTLTPQGWEVPAGQLHRFDPQRRLAALRRLINSHGGDRANGYLIAFIDGEFEPRRGVYVLHLHALAAGGMRTVIDQALRNTAIFKTDRANYGRTEWVYRRIRFDPGLSNLPRQLTYLLKSWWPARWQGLNPTGKVIRARRKRRISEPHHTEVLLWLDRWRLNDIALLMNVRAGRTGFELAPRAYTNDPRS